MGDKRRFDLFAKFIAEKVTDKNARIADVAAGKGYLTFALKRMGYKHVTPFEPNPRKGGQVIRTGMHVREFNADLASDFDVVVGMHPDSATDQILNGACLAGISAIICPCCIRPSTWTYWGGNNFFDWTKHLIQESAKRGMMLDMMQLKMDGKNLVLFSN